MCLYFLTATHLFSHFTIYYYRETVYCNIDWSHKCDDVPPSTPPHPHIQVQTGRESNLAEVHQ